MYAWQIFGRWIDSWFRCFKERVRRIGSWHWMEASISLKPEWKFFDLCRKVLHSSQVLCFLLFVFLFLLLFFFFLVSPFPKYRVRRLASSKWDCIRLAERSATVTVNNYSEQWRKPWQLPIIAISPWQTPTYCRWTTIYDDAETRVAAFAVIILVLVRISVGPSHSFGKSLCEPFCSRDHPPSVDIMR